MFCSTRAPLKFTTRPTERELLFPRFWPPSGHSTELFQRFCSSEGDSTEFRPCRAALNTLLRLRFPRFWPLSDHSTELFQRFCRLERDSTERTPSGPISYRGENTQAKTKRSQTLTEGGIFSSDEERLTFHERRESLFLNHSPSSSSSSSQSSHDGYCSILPFSLSTTGFSLCFSSSIFCTWIVNIQSSPKS